MADTGRDVMRLHVLAGPGALLCPSPLEGERTAELVSANVGANVRSVPAFWFSRSGARFYHDFLQEPHEDRRIAVFARSIADDFGTRFSPLVILPSLLDEISAAARESAPPSARDVLVRVWADAGAASLCLIAIALAQDVDPDAVWSGGLGPEDVDASLAALRTDLVALGLPAGVIETRLIVAGPGLPAFPAMHRNALAARIVEQLAGRFEAEGLRLDPSAAAASTASMLDGWSRGGLEPAPALTRRAFDGLTDRAAGFLLAGGRAGG